MLELKLRQPFFFQLVENLRLQYFAVCHLHEVVTVVFVEKSWEIEISDVIMRL